VVILGDFEQPGVEREFLMFIYLSKVHVIKTGCWRRWQLRALGATPIGSFGAGWNYEGKVFMSENAGKGVYEIVTNTVNLKQLSVVVKRVGSSDPTNYNDGMNCMWKAPPQEWGGPATQQPTVQPTTATTTSTTAFGRSAESPATQEQDQSLDTESETANEDFKSSGPMPSDMPIETPTATPTDVPAEADEIASETANDDLANSVPPETQDADLPAEVDDNESETAKDDLANSVPPETQHATETSSETCQDFCRGKCKCLKPWKERCLVKSCAGCSECANV